MNGSRCVIEGSFDAAGIARYAEEIGPTDVLDPNDLNPVLHGLFGEVGGIMATAKKHVREGVAFPGYQRAAMEELGDTLWYLAALCRRLSVPLSALLGEAAAAPSQLALPLPGHRLIEIDVVLTPLGKATAAMLGERPNQATLLNFAIAFRDTLEATGISLNSIACENLAKARGAFLNPKPENLPDFDHMFGVEEQLPRDFRIRVSQRAMGRSYLQWNGVFIGDPLTDNIADPDGYRFHDVFHFAFAAILHWSPVVRALLKQKRKSSPHHDEAQDSGRAIVVEEGLSAWLFARAGELNYFEGQDRVSLSLLKTISDFVRGYEVTECPLKLWEYAILEGYRVFREIRAAHGGWIIGDRSRRTIAYAPLD